MSSVRTNFYILKTYVKIQYVEFPVEASVYPSALPLGQLPVVSPRPLILYFLLLLFELLKISHPLSILYIFNNPYMWIGLSIGLSKPETRSYSKPETRSYSPLNRESSFNLIWIEPSVNKILNLNLTSDRTWISIVQPELTSVHL